MSVHPVDDPRGPYYIVVGRRALLDPGVFQVGPVPLFQCVTPELLEWNRRVGL